MLAALNERMLRLAGELADGVLLNYLPAAAVPWCVEQVRGGESAAGRSAGSCSVYAYVHVGVCDPGAARTPARKDLFSYAVVPAYAKAFERAGFADEIAALGASPRRRRSRRCRRSGVGPHDRRHRHLRRHRPRGRRDEAYVDAGVEHPVIMPLPWGPDRVTTIESTLAAVRPR